MALKIRLRKQGRHNRPFYRLVLADVHSKRDGKYMESLGWYNPFEEQEDKHLNLKAGRIQYWIAQGVEVSECARDLLLKGAPEVAQFQTDKKLAQRAHACLKRKERKARAKAKAKA